MLSALRKAGVPMQRIRPAVSRLSQEFGLDQLRLPAYATAEDLVDRFEAGDGFAEIAADFAVPAPEVEDVIRVALRLAA